jgi:hypothetical protein
MSRIYLVNLVSPKVDPMVEYLFQITIEVQLVSGKIDLSIFIHLGKFNTLDNTGNINELKAGLKIRKLFA